MYIYIKNVSIFLQFFEFLVLHFHTHYLQTFDTILKLHLYLYLISVQ